MKFINLAVVKFSVLVLLGILVANYCPISFSVITLLPVLFLILLILWFVFKNSIFQNNYFGIFTYLIFFIIGYATYQVRLPEFHTNHFSKVISEEKPELIQLKVYQTLKPDKFNNKFLANVLEVDGNSTSGKVLLSISKDSISEIYLPDKILLVSGSIKEISKSPNPYQFEFSEYMGRLGVYDQIWIKQNNILKQYNGRTTLKGYAERIRSGILKKLSNTNLKTNERAIIQALVLGEKRDISKRLYNDYAAAGAVHILAVSGLHVGIIYLFLAFIFRPFKRLRYGKYIHSILIIAFLWGFALLSGMSPSVSRAVTMFSFFAFATLINRRTNSINTLFLSLLTLLLINPQMLFQVGFQLSYLAVFSILWIQPKLQALWQPENLVLKRFWSLTSVTLAAQIGVMPISLYYFHQFPGLFLLTNIVVLPFIGILMCGGIVIVILSVLEILPNWLSEIYNYSIEILNAFVTWVANQNSFLFTDIPFSSFKAIASYILIIALVLLWKKPSYKTTISTLLAFSIVISSFIWDKKNTTKNEFYIFHKSKTTLMGYNISNKLMVFKQVNEDSIRQRYPIKSYAIAKNIEMYSEQNIPKVFRYNNKTILIIDSLGSYSKNIKANVVVLTHSPKINISRLIEELEPEQIIADGSNYVTYVKRWEKTCHKKKLPFHHTGEQGAFLLE